LHLQNYKNRGRNYNIAVFELMIFVFIIARISAALLI